MEIIQTEVSRLIPYARNARTHSAAQVAQIAASIKERWLFCPENDCYAVGVSGAVYRVCRRQKTKTGGTTEEYKTIVLRGSVDRCGYLVFRMVVNGKKKHVKGHRLVAAAFLGGHPTLVVNHKDGNKKNNSLENLEWATVAENNAHSISTGLLDPRTGGTKNAKVKKYDYVTIFAMNKNAGFTRAELARLNNVSRQTIDNVINKTAKVLEEIHATS